MRRAIYLYFFFSGLAGLIYEVLWVRLFVMVMGGTVYSFTTVLVAFMTGLTLGGWLGGKYSDRMQQSPLLVYGVLEGLIGLYCLFIPFLIGLLNPVFTASYPFLLSHNFAGLLLRFFFSGLVLVVPCTLMGATLPVLVRYSYSKPEQFGSTMAGLYATNTFGAVAGSFISAMVLIPWLGQRNTIYLAAGINLLIFGSILAFRASARPEFTPLKPEFAETEKTRKLTSRAALVLALYALSGAAAMVYQVAWTRALILSLGTTLYVLGLILTAFIAGLGIGAAAVAFLVDRLKRLWLWVGVFEFVIGLSAWAVVPLFARLPLYTALLAHPASYYSWLSIEFLIGFALVFLPTFMMGVLMPVVVRLYAQLQGGVGAAVGEVYAWNTIGAIVGSFLCGFFLIQWLGLKNCLVLASALSLLIGAAFMLCDQGLGAMRAVAPVAACALTGAFLYFTPGWKPELINSGPYLYFAAYRQAASSVQELVKSLESGPKVLFYKEGVEATVMVSENTAENIVSLKINGKADASSGKDMITQVLAGHLPLLLHPKARQAAVVGLASGVSLGAVLDHKVEHAVCIEISPEVAAGSKYFENFNQRPLNDPRTTLIINDARFHLMHSSDKYDVIMSEPSNPWIGGEGLLFTKEYFQQARARLNPGGVMLIWIGIYDLNLESVRMIARTFAAVFPDAALWEANFGGDYLLTGFNGPLKIDYSGLKQEFNRPEVRQDLERVGLDSPEKIISRFLMGPEQLKQFADGGPLHVDDRRQLELTVPAAHYMKSYEENTLGTMKNFLQYRTSPEALLSFSGKDDEKDLALVGRLNAARRMFMEAFIMLASRAPLDQSLDLLRKAYDVDPADPWAKEMLFTFYAQKANTALQERNFEEALMNYITAWKYSPKGSVIPALAGFYYLDQGQLQTAAEWAKQALSKNPRDSLAWTLLGRIQLAMDSPKEAIALFERALDNFKNYRDDMKNSAVLRAFGQSDPSFFQSQTYFYMGEAFRQMGNKPEALKYYEQALYLNPKNVEALVASGKMFLDLGQLDAALGRYSKAVEIAPQNPFAHLLYSQALERDPNRVQQAASELNQFLELAPKDWPGRAKVEQHLSQLLRGR
jgi:spermidine synthase